MAQAVERRSRVASAEDRLSWALGAIGHGVVIFDERGEVVYRNDPAASFLAARHSDALVEEAISTMAADALRGRRVERELELFGPPRRILNVRAVPLADPAQPSGVLVVVEDTSERRRLENVRRDFVANISHELKTPVGALALLAETLLDERRPRRDPPAGRAPGQRGVPGGTHHRRPARAVAPGGGVGARQRPGAGRDVRERGLPTGCGPPPSSAASSSRSRTRPPASRWSGERRQLVSAVTNLLDNAVKYSEPGSTVEVQARTDGTWVDVTVRDHGIGIPRRDLERIFERFYRVDRARSRETGGTGLGLAIVRHVASNHRGEVRVESREGVGSTFTLRLPAGPGPVAVTKEAG